MWNIVLYSTSTLRWRHNRCDSVSNHQPHECLLNRLFRRRWKKTSKPRVTGLCAGNSPVTGEFPAQMASNAENVSIGWRHHEDVMNTPKVYSFVLDVVANSTAQYILFEMWWYTSVYVWICVFRCIFISERLYGFRHVYMPRWKLRQ